MLKKKRVRRVNEYTIQELIYLAERGVRYTIANGRIARVTSNI